MTVRVRVGVGVVVGLVALLSTACFTPFDVDGLGATSLVWWNYDTHQWQRFDPENPSTPTVLATGLHDDSEGWAGDYDGDGRYELGILEKTWFGPYILWDDGGVPWGWPTVPSDPGPHSCGCGGKRTPFPVFGAYDGGHKTLPAYYVAQDATWHISGREPFTFGRPMHADGLPDWDIPVPGDYDGDGTTDPAVYNPWSGEWTALLHGQPVVVATYGGQGLPPLPADWNGDGTTDPAFYTSAELMTGGNTYINLPYGFFDGKLPMLGDYNADGAIDPGVWDHTTRTWTTTVVDKEGPSRAIHIERELVIGNSSPAPLLGIAWLNGEQARLAYLHTAWQSTH